MPADADIGTASLAEIREMAERGEIKAPEAGPAFEIPETFWRNARRVVPEAPTKGEPVELHIDSDVLAWFRNQGTDYRARINAVLRAYYEAKRKAEEPKR